jgi:hypothetical protein
VRRKQRGVRSQARLLDPLGALTSKRADFRSPAGGGVDPGARVVVASDDEHQLNAADGGLLLRGVAEAVTRLKRPRAD